VAAYIVSVLVDVCMSHCSGVNVNFHIFLRESLVHSLVNNELLYYQDARYELKKKCRDTEKNRDKSASE